MNKREIKTREDVCVADLHDLNIVSSVPACIGYMANIYVSNEDDDVYIGELCDHRLVALVRKAPKIAELLQLVKSTGVFDPARDQEWETFIDELGQELGIF